MEEQVPSNWMTPLPSRPLTVCPLTVIEVPSNSCEGPPAFRVKFSGDLERKSKAAGVLTEPTLQMPKTGSTGEEKVMLSMRGGTPGVDSPSRATEAVPGERCRWCLR